MSRPLTAAELEAALAGLPPVTHKDRSRGQRRRNDSRALRRRIGQGRWRDTLPMGFGKNCDEADDHEVRPLAARLGLCPHHYLRCSRSTLKAGYYRKNRLPSCWWCGRSCPDYSYERLDDRRQAAEEIEDGLDDWEDREILPIAYRGGSMELHSRGWDSYC